MLIESYGRVQTPISGPLKASLFIGGLILFLVLEKTRPLRYLRHPKVRRFIRNLTLGGASAVVLNLTLLPMVYLVARFTADKQWGLLYMVPLPTAVTIVGGLLLMDYTFYWWHYWNHAIPFLWRFHNVHHVDLDLDVTTAVRFHFGELLLSTFFRSSQLLILGIDPFTWILFEISVVASTQFHHSNWKLPVRLEAWLNKVIVTPRMHGIHHSIVQGETNSNFSTIFSFWDKIHRSLDVSVPQSQITIGVPSYQNPDELNLFDLFLLPFRKQRPWILSNGQVPKRLIAPPREPTLQNY